MAPNIPATVPLPPPPPPAKKSKTKTPLYKHEEVVCQPGADCDVFRAYPLPRQTKYRVVTTSPLPECCLAFARLLPMAVRTLSYTSHARVLQILKSSLCLFIVFLSSAARAWLGQSVGAAANPPPPRHYTGGHVRSSQAALDLYATSGRASHVRPTYSLWVLKTPPPPPALRVPTLEHARVVPLISAPTFGTMSHSSIRPTIDSLFPGNSNGVERLQRGGETKHKTKHEKQALGQQAPRALR